MKIVELITFLSGGGAERFIVDLSNEISKENDTYLVTILDDKKEPEIRNFYRSEISENVHYLNLGIPNGLKFSSQWRVYKELRKLKPDVIHVHMIPTLKYSAMAIGLLSITNKVYFSVHNDLHNGYDKGILRLYCNTFGRINRFKLSCLSEKNYQDFKQFYPHTTIRCITNGRASLVTTRDFISVKKEMMSYRSTPNSRLLIHIARFHPQKNQKLLIETVNNLVEDGYNIGLVVLGTGFDSIEGKELTASACRRIHFLGAKKNIADYMLNADIFCLSSDYEGMPITLLEASLAGVPAVSTPVCGAVDLIQDGINGFLSRSHNLADYKDALIEAIEKFELIKTNAMRMKHNSPYTIEKCAQKYIEYFNE